MDLSMDKMFINFQALDPIEFGKQVLLKFEIYFRMVAILLAIIVFACVADTGLAYFQAGGNNGFTICVYDGDAGSCNYAIAVGVIAMLSNILFLLIDVAIEVIIQPLVYRIITVCVLLFNILWAFNWFILFCLLVNRWNSTGFKNVLTSLPISNAQAAIAFSFFSILIYIPIVLLGVLRVLRGPGFLGDISYYQQLFKLKSPYGKFDEPESGGDSYQAAKEETY